MITRDEAQATLCPEVDLVAGTAAELRSTLRQLVGSGVRQLVLDLAGVQMVDSAGLELLIAAHNSLQKVGGQLSVVRASPEILELLTSMRIHQHFQISGE